MLGPQAWPIAVLTSLSMRRRTVVFVWAIFTEGSAPSEFLTLRRWEASSTAELSSVSTLPVLAITTAGSQERGSEEPVEHSWGSNTQHRVAGSRVGAAKGENTLKG